MTLIGRHERAAGGLEVAVARRRAGMSLESHRAV